jgi:flavin reductase (DIM6/NTAB) family NADH-FMN oxidoreductase RutF
MRSSTADPRIRHAGSIAVDVLARDQQHVSNHFAQTGTDKWAGVRWRKTQAGAPVPARTVTWADCQVWAEHDAGDHLVVIGQVEDTSPVDPQHPVDPLLSVQGRYRHLDPDSAAAHSTRTEEDHR